MVYQEGMSDKLREVRKDASLLNIEGNGYDIGRAVVYLCSIGQDTLQDKHLLLMEDVHYLISQEDEINYI